MYLSSPSIMRLALGPGSEVLSLGPIKVLVDMGSSKNGRWSFVDGRWPRKGDRAFSALEPDGLRLLITRLRRQKGGSKLVGTEEAGTRLRGQHCQIPARAHQEVQPARGQMRIWILEAHDYSLSIA